ncbi:MFS transporter [Sutterella sp.]|uniref:AmpG family muropeptide MFS transporter n=1 Tax=Sutterella sp. TaxID=1981025 RepID=UPI0026DF808F|nr:MFS transporter [Sutterella sp.]MDO5530404.1 MFS transporter [Sutterella sp.]
MADERKRSSWRVYAEPGAVRMAFFGFSSGLPLLLVIGTLGFWLREAGVDLRTIGFFSWVGLIYGFKWLWAPLVDRLPMPFLSRGLGQRRAWLLAAQVLLIAGLAGLATADPRESLVLFAGLALVTAFASATQDIALDAYRIESAGSERQAAYAAMYQTGYRLGMIWAGAGALAIAAWAAGGGTGYLHEAWTVSYGVMAASGLVGVAATLLSPEPAHAPRTAAPEGEKRSLVEKVRRALVDPFTDFFSRFGWAALAVLALVASYRISDVVMGVMANPFYQDLGFTKEQVAAVSKIFGVVMTLAGAFIGGAAAMRWGVLRVLLAGAVLSSVTNLLFSVLARIGADLGFLVVTVSADNLAAGLASAAFVAYLSGLTSAGYSATQYALFSSLMLLLPKFLAGFSGIAVEAMGYSGFFIGTAALGLPVCLLVLLVMRVAPGSAASGK